MDNDDMRVWARLTQTRLKTHLLFLQSDILLVPSSSSDSPDLVDATQEEHASQEAPRELVEVETQNMVTKDVPNLTKTSGSSADAGEVEQCPITLLTGFLGSGKTTLLE